MDYQPNETLLEIYERVFPALLELQTAAKLHNIPDIFQDNGGKTYEVCSRLGLTPLPGREGNDAVDSFGTEYEIKTINLDGTVTAYSIHHTVTENVLEKYRTIKWVFAEYRGIELQDVYVVSPDKMKEFIDLWQTKKAANPKFKASLPIKIVRQIGELSWSKHATLF